MKSVKKILFGAFAFAALSFGLASCADDEEESLKCVAEYVGTGSAQDSDGDICTCTVRASFYNNKEYKIDMNATAVATGESVATATIDGTIEIGTYTGDATKDGTIRCTATKEYDGEQEKLVSVANKTTDEVTVANGEFTLDLSDEFENLELTLKRK